jgi:hypothetical protein
MFERSPRSFRCIQWLAEAAADARTKPERRSVPAQGIVSTGVGPHLLKRQEWQVLRGAEPNGTSATVISGAVE